MAAWAAIVLLALAQLAHAASAPSPTLSLAYCDTLRSAAAKQMCTDYYDAPNSIAKMVAASGWKRGDAATCECFCFGGGEAGVGSERLAFCCSKRHVSIARRC